MSKKTKTCPGGCNVRHKGEADYAAGGEPWRCLKFRCEGCKRWRPWCNGATDSTPDLCDACAMAGEAVS